MRGRSFSRRELLCKMSLNPENLSKSLLRHDIYVGRFIIRKVGIIIFAARRDSYYLTAFASGKLVVKNCGIFCAEAVACNDCSFESFCSGYAICEKLSSFIIEINSDAFPRRVITPYNLKSIWLLCKRSISIQGISSTQRWLYSHANVVVYL